MFNQLYSYSYHSNSTSCFTIVQDKYHLPILLSPIYSFSLTVQAYCLEMQIDNKKQSQYLQTYTGKARIPYPKLYCH